MDHGRAADSEFEIAADRTLDSRDQGKIGNLLRATDPAGFAYVDRKDVGSLEVRQRPCILQRVDAFVGNDRELSFAADFSQGGHILRWHWLFGKIDITLLFELSDCFDSCLGRPTSVGIDAEFDSGSDRSADGTN